MGKKEKTYTESIKELEDILARMEKGDMDIDILAEEVKKASDLIKICKDKLYKTDQNIKSILDKIE